jgi:hypothetical protein
VENEILTKFQDREFTDHWTIPSYFTVSLQQKQKLEKQSFKIQKTMNEVSPSCSTQQDKYTP